MSRLALVPRIQESAPPPPPRRLDSVLPLILDRVSFDAGGRRLLDGVSLGFRGDARTVILGPNGAGKSLLLRLCHGLLQPTAGAIRWALNEPRILRRAQAMVFQRPVLLRRSVEANIRHALAMQGVQRGARKVLAGRALEQVGLSKLARRPAPVLSGGEQQRLALARAWALSPQVLFLDEPTANLDPAATRHIESIIDGIHRNGTRIIMTTHDLGQARRHADEVIFLHRGRVLEHAPAADFFSRARSREGRLFLAGELLD